MYRARVEWRLRKTQDWLATGWLVAHSEVIQFDGLSAFRPCGPDLVELSNSTVWAFYVKLTPNRPTSGWPVMGQQRS